MKFRHALLALTFCSSYVSMAQLNFNTGSPELDSDLNSINVTAKVDLGVFKVDLSAEFGVPSKDIDAMFSLKLEPAEVYLVLEISKISGKPSSDVITCYKTNKSKGWGYIAKEMGIKPGSPEFHELKGNSKNKKAKGNSSKPANNGNGNNGNSKNKMH